MSHKVLAKIWHVLVSRPNVSNFLREITGSYILSTINVVGRWKRYASWELVIWLKVVFDAQRSLARDKPHLVDTKLLLAFIDFVIELRRENWDECGEQLDKEALEWRMLFGPTLLSGLRAFHLRQTLLSSERKNDLARKLGGWKNHAEDDLELLFIRLCQEAVKEIPVNADELEELKHLSTVDLPRWHTSKLRPTTSMRAELFKAFRSQGDSSDRQRFWVQYDILSLLDSAFISACGPSGGGKSDKRYIAETRAKVLEEMECASDNDSILVLKIAVLHWCQNNCNCAEEIDETPRTPKAVSSLPMDRELHRMLTYLEARIQEVAHSESNFQQFGARLGEKIRRWRGEDDDAPDADSVSTEANSLDMVTYVVNCPELHRVAAPRLWALSLDPSVRQRLRNLAEEVKFQLLPHCPECREQTTISKARRVTPLDRFWSEIREGETNVSPKSPLSLIEEYPVSLQAESLPKMTSKSSTPVNHYSTSGSSPRNLDGSSTTSSTEAIEQPQNSKSNHKRRFSGFSAFSHPGSLTGGSNGVTPTKKPSSMSYPSRFVFSADSSTLLLWEKDKNDVIVCDLSTLAVNSEIRHQPHMNTNRLEIHSVSVACAGTDTIVCVCAALREDLDHSSKTIRVFKKTPITEEGSVHLAHSGQRSLGPGAVSRDDRYFAILQGEELLIYKIESIVQRMADPSFTASLSCSQDEISSQAVNFSANSQEIIVATRSGARDGRHVVHLQVLNVNGRERVRKIVKISERGMLNSVHSLPEYHIAVVGVLDNTGYFVLHDTSTTHAIHHWHNLCNIQSTTASWTGQYVIFAMRDGIILRCDASDLNKKGEKLGKVKCTDPHLKMGMTEDEVIQGFWFDSSKRRYNVFQIDPHGKKILEGSINISGDDLLTTTTRTRTSSTSGG